ncbi:MAG: hypothetical protein ABI273_09095 [Lacunisphaera sp.]
MSVEKDYSGELRCSDGLLSYKSEGISWNLKIPDIRLVGEYTTANGPYIDDYFLVFLTAFEGGWHEASFYARGRDQVLPVLGAALGAPIEPGLCRSTDYKTRIIWPLKWKDQELMEVLPRKTKGLVSRLFDSGERDIIPSKAMREVFGHEQALQ